MTEPIGIPGTAIFFGAPFWKTRAFFFLAKRIGFWNAISLAFATTKLNLDDPDAMKLMQEHVISIMQRRLLKKRPQITRPQIPLGDPFNQKFVVATDNHIITYQLNPTNWLDMLSILKPALVEARIRELSNSSPDIDLTKFEDVLKIKIIDVQKKQAAPNVAGIIIGTKRP